MTIRQFSNVAALSGPINQLRLIADQCCNELDPYSRWLGRNSKNTENQVAAIALLPDELAATHEATEVVELSRLLESSIDKKGLGLIPATDLMNIWPCDTDGKLTKSEASLLAQLLQKRGYGIEPDSRLSGPTLRASDTAVPQADSYRQGCAATEHSQREDSNLPSAFDDRKPASLLPDFHQSSERPSPDRRTYR